MQIVVYYENGWWRIRIEYSVGVVVGKTLYRTREEAVLAAQQQHPSKAIKVQDEAK